MEGIGKGMSKGMRYVQAITVESARNGFMVRCSKKPKKSKNGYDYPEPDTTVHESADSALAQVRKLMGAMEMPKGRSLASLGDEAARVAKPVAPKAHAGR